MALEILLSVFLVAVASDEGTSDRSIVWGCPGDHALVAPKVLSKPVYGREIKVQWTGTIFGLCSGSGAASRFGTGQMRYRFVGEKEYRKANAARMTANYDKVVYICTLPPFEKHDGDEIEFYFEGVFDFGKYRCHRPDRPWFIKLRDDGRE
jgi:hypothetical protein